MRDPFTWFFPGNIPLTRLAVLLLAWDIGSADAGPPNGKARSPRAVAAEIDRLIQQKLTETKIPSSPGADDAEFIRRLSLDLIGRIPLGERVEAFLKDTGPNRREKL